MLQLAPLLTLPIFIKITCHYQPEEMINWRLKRPILLEGFVSESSPGCTSVSVCRTKQEWEAQTATATAATSIAATTTTETINTAATSCFIMPNKLLVVDPWPPQFQSATWGKVLGEVFFYLNWFVSIRSFPLMDATNNGQTEICRTKYALS